MDSTSVNPNFEMKLNEVVDICMTNYGVQYTIEHFMEIRQSYYAQTGRSVDQCDIKMKF